ncbi:MAG: response regulator [Calditrichaeota bacterium]|nr:response regulator [Calditrichota bacterium]MCB9367627.1 response regulator [Calditrichota bacterium]
MSDLQKKILTIDDERAVRNSLRAYLEDSDFDVIEACDGQKGIELIKSENPDLVLCDLRMPNVDGLEVVRFVSQNKPEMPIIIVSGTGVIGDAVEAVRLGAWDYVLKPIEDMGALEHIILKALDRARLVRENRQYKEHLVDEVRRQTSEIREQAEQLERANAALRLEIVEREKAEQIVADSEQRYRELVDNLQEGLGSVNSNEVFTFCNMAMARIFETTPSDLIGRSLLDFLPDTSQRMVLKQTRERSQGRVGMYEIEIRTANGNTRHILVHSRPMFDVDNNFVGASSLIQDVTEQRKLEQHLRHAQKMETIGTLAGGIAHDFNNILTPILGYAEMAIADWGVREGSKENIEQIVTAALRARDLVKQILLFSRQNESSKEPTEIQLVVREAVKLLRSTLPAEIEITDQIDRQSALVLADATQIHQLVMNLCTNAFHAMEEKGGELSIGLSQVLVDSSMAELYPSLKAGPYLRLTVSDTGCGMSKELQEKVFEPFFTTKEAGKGTGLGLSIAHGIVAEHSGHIALYSELGQGTTFQVYLPQLFKGEKHSNSNEPVQLSGTERILLVDDEKQIAEMTTRILDRLGYRVTTFTNSQEALDRFLAGPDDFDLLITDLNMPKISGTKLILSIHAERPSLPVIAFSGFSEKITETNCASYGIKHFVMKPVVTMELAGVIRDAIGPRSETVNPGKLEQVKQPK